MQKRRGKAYPPIKLFQSRFINYHALTGAKDTAKVYSRVLENLLRRFPEKTEPGQFTPQDIEDYRIIRRRENASASTVNLEVAVVKAFWNWMKRMSGLPLVNPARFLKNFRAEIPVKRALNFSSMQAVLNAASDERDKLMLVLLFTTGLRGGELLQLRKEFFDFEAKTLTLPPEICKGKKGRVVTLRDDVARLIAKQPKGKIFAWKKVRTIRTRYRWLCEKAGIPYTGLHATRHSFGTNMIRSGADVVTVQELMGHSSANTTMKYLRAADAETTRKFLEEFPTIGGGDVQKVDSPVAA